MNETVMMNSAEELQKKMVPGEPAKSRRSRSRARRLPSIPRAARETVNRLLDEKRSGEEIVARVRESGISLSLEEVGAWKESGYQRWLNEREQLESFHRLHQFAAEVAQAELGCHLQELGLHMVAAQVCELLSDFDARQLKKKLSNDLGQYVHLVNAVTRLSEGGLKYEQYRAELAEAKAKIEKELSAARKSGGLSPETIEKIERELNLF